MKTKEKVRYWLTKYPELRDDDNRLCANIWSEEIKQIKDIPDKISSFLIAYAANKLTAAPSIKRARAKLQEEEPELRGKIYNIRKGKIQDEWKKELGYEINK